MYSWVNLGHVIQWCSGVPHYLPLTTTHIRAFSTDSRSVSKGDLFIALKGDRFDGHDYIEEASRRGALAVVAERKVGDRIPQIIVGDSLWAMVSMARGIRERFSGKVIAITGSAGKSSTKEMLSVLLGAQTVYSPASFNNLIGVSKTLFLVDDMTKNLVLEMGMNARGEIEELCRNFQPHMGLITNIGDAHMGKLGGQQGVYFAKKELFDHLAGLSYSGVALNLDDSLVMKAFWESFKKSPDTVTYSIKKEKNADISVSGSRMDSATGELMLKLNIKGQVQDTRLPIFGLHHGQNIAATAAAAVLLGVSVSDLGERIKKIRPAQHRGELNSFSEAIVVDESYNSNPSALRSSLESVFHLAPERRHVLILGDMLELGEFSESLHREAGKNILQILARTGSPMVLIGVGQWIAHLIHEIKSNLPSVMTYEVLGAREAIGTALKVLKPGDVILVKGSRGNRLDMVVEELLKFYGARG